MIETFEDVDGDTWFEITNPAINNENCECGDSVKFLGVFNGDRTAGTFYVERTETTVILTCNDVSLEDVQDAEFEEVQEEEDDDNYTGEYIDTSTAKFKTACNTIIIIIAMLCLTYCSLHSH